MSKSQRRLAREAYKKVREEEKELVILEGELLKLCPGIERKVMRADRDLNGGALYIPRWCQLTHNKFRYYKNQ